MAVEVVLYVPALVKVVCAVVAFFGGLLLVAGLIGESRQKAARTKARYDAAAPYREARRIAASRPNTRTDKHGRVEVWNDKTGWTLK